jgi:hypothetical protein
MKAVTLADELRREADLLRRRLVHHTRPKGSLTMDEAADLCRRMDGEREISSNGSQV